MAKRKSKFEKLWTKEGGSNEKNKFLARRYFLAALNWATETDDAEVFREIEALEAE